MFSVAPVVSTPDDAIYSRGDDVTLICTAMGGPDNVFQWMDSSNAVVESSSTLTLANVTATDGGEYTCMVSNAGGVSSASTSVFISPYFIVEPQDVGGASGTMVTLTCMAEAFPAPTYQWSRVGMATISSTATGESSETLVFNSLAVGDEGDYICNATSNGISVQSQPATLSG